MADEPKAPEIPEREKLAQALEAEKSARGKRVLEFIQAYCKENNCLFIATPRFEPSPEGGWVIRAYPGVAPQ